MKFRLRFIDVFRGLAIVLMLHGHTADALLSPDEKNKPRFSTLHNLPRIHRSDVSFHIRIRFCYNNNKICRRLFKIFTKVSKTDKKISLHNTAWLLPPSPLFIPQKKQ